MFNKLKNYLQIAWAMPFTLLCYVFYILPCTMLGWYRYLGKYDDAYVFTVVRTKTPEFLNKLWNAWLGQTLGLLVVMKISPKSILGESVLRHEQVHVEQCKTLGPFQPFAYVAAGLYSMLKGKEYYKDNYYEVEARAKSEKQS